ncbi:sigma-70 family RNA polymerase sigma factor [Planctomicrobium sp. SH661]|uniref:sigma-70 family RNA polymerase sigma factor n=1 Tax=Planctomicrobium sp. SH661 TaxID=3448124 RepID=UPI003F5B5F6D
MQNPFDIDELRAELSEPSHEAEFLHQLSGAYRTIYACALSIVGNRADADDVVQEVCAIIWKKYWEFTPGTNFTKWATAVAFKSAKAFVRDRRRQGGLGLREGILDKVAKVRTAGAELFELRRECLDECIAKLSDQEQKFLLNCYRPHRNLVEFSNRTRIPIATVYTRLKRLRKRLTECVTRAMGNIEP